MYYACTLDRFTGELITADLCDSYEDAEQFIREELSIWKPTQKAAILNETQYREARGDF